MNKEKCLEMWNFLKEEKSLDKDEYFEFYNKEKKDFCFACKEAGKIYSNELNSYIYNCKNCPIDWPILDELKFEYKNKEEILNNELAPCEHSLYMQWELVADKIKFAINEDCEEYEKELVEYADQIIKLIEDTWE